MAPIKKHVQGLENLLAEINKSDQNASIYILLCGSKNEKGESWCPDCVKAEPFVNAAVDKLKDGVVFIHCEVGPKDQWKTPSNPFRTHPDFRLTAVPTLLKWKGSKRLVEDECSEKDLLEMMFEGDTK